MKCPKCTTPLAPRESYGAVLAECPKCRYAVMPMGKPLPASEVFSFRETVWRRLHGGPR